MEGRPAQEADDMDEILTLAEIEERYKSEWILVEDPELDEQLEVIKGKVLWHSKDRDEVYQKSIDLAPKHAALLYTGEIPEDAVVVL
jgi:hypothetical protein